MSYQPVKFILFFFTTVVSQPILEEILFRGILQEKLSRVSFWLSIIVTSVIFSYIHG
ncbi:TPA: lysostaphin resistance A-like protein, partial [Streptococcus pyogenes]